MCFKYKYNQILKDEKGNLKNILQHSTKKSIKLSLFSENNKIHTLLAGLRKTNIYKIVGNKDEYNYKIQQKCRKYMRIPWVNFCQLKNMNNFLEKCELQIRSQKKQNTGMPVNIKETGSVVEIFPQSTRWFDYTKHFLLPQNALETKKWCYTQSWFIILIALSDKDRKLRNITG